MPDLVVEPGAPVQPTGFNKWGMSNAVAALMLTDRIAGRSNAWAEVFDTNRFSARQSVAELVKENADVARLFVGERTRADGTGKSTKVTDGEGNLVDTVPVTGIELVEPQPDGLRCVCARNAEAGRACERRAGRGSAVREMEEGAALRERGLKPTARGVR